jgi:DNA primase
MRTQRDNDKGSFHLIDHLIKTIDLPELIEMEANIQLKWSKGNNYAKSVCPFPDHRDSKASFFIKRMGENNAWVFHCFGCSKKGNVIHFCMDFFGLRNKYEAILFLCKKYKIENKEDIILASLKNITKRVDIQRKIEAANIVSSNQCRILLRKDVNKHKDWVLNAYKTLNLALEKEDYEAIENIGYEASNRMQIQNI